MFNREFIVLILFNNSNAFLVCRNIYIFIVISIGLLRILQYCFWDFLCLFMNWFCVFSFSLFVYFYGVYLLSLCPFQFVIAFLFVFIRLRNQNTVLECYTYLVLLFVYVFGLPLDFYGFWSLPTWHFILYILCWLYTCYFVYFFFDFVLCYFWWFVWLGGVTPLRKLHFICLKKVAIATETSHLVIFLIYFN